LGRKHEELCDVIQKELENQKNCERRHHVSEDAPSRRAPTPQKLQNGMKLDLNYYNFKNQNFNNRKH
jgi:hypothetical protein